MDKEKKNVYYSKLFRDFAKVRPILRALCLRGYKDRDGYRSLAVANGGYDSILAEIKFALQEEGVIEERRGENGKIHYFHNQPLLKQDNPLAEIWRFAKPNRKAIFFYMTILELAQREGGVTKAKIVNEINARGAKQSADEALTKVESSVERALKEMQQLMLIREVSAEGERERRFKLGSDIWQGFCTEELEDIYIYLDFLKNVVPFELPYYLLQKHLELYFYCCGEERRLQQIKPMFLFRHRNPVNVLESEMMYYFLRYAKHGVNSGKDVHYQKKMRDYEMSTPKYWVEGLPIVWFQDIYGQVESLEYDCVLNAVYKKGKMYQMDSESGDEVLEEETKRYNFIGSDFFVAYADEEDKEELKKKKAEYAKYQEEIRPLFHEINGIYFEKIFKLWREKGEYSENELRRRLFCAEEPDKSNGENLKYWDSHLEKMLMPKDEEYALFEYNRESKKYVVRNGKIEVPIATRIQREALQSLEEFTFTKFFLSDETMQKIRKHTSGFISEWSVRDINIVNQEHRQEEGISGDRLQKILKAMRRNKALCGKDGRSYIPLRLQYSLRYDEFRLLAADEERGDCQMLALEKIDFEKKPMDHVITWKEKEAWMQTVADKQLSKTFQIQFDWDSAYWDNISSEDLMMLLSAYDKIVDYTIHKPEEESGKFTIEVKYWPEDEADLLEDIKKVLNNYKIYIME